MNFLPLRRSLVARTGILLTAIVWPLLPIHSHAADTSSSQKPGVLGRLEDWKRSKSAPTPRPEDNPPLPADRPSPPAGRQGFVEFDRRLKLAGAKTGDIQISLAWNTIDDVDLYVDYSPNMEFRGQGQVEGINYRNRVGHLSGGMLDVDMNAGGNFSRTPVENIFWPPGSSPQGFFKVGAHLYASRTHLRSVPIVIRIKIGDDVKVIKSSVQRGQQTRVIRQFQHPAAPPSN